MRRSGPIRRKRGIRRQSESGLMYQLDYLDASDIVEARAGGRCEIRSTHDCDGLSTGSPHHRKMRSQGGSNDPDNLIAVCWTGHQWIHQQLPRAEAERMQLLIPRDTPEYPYNPGMENL